MSFSYEVKSEIVRGEYTKTSAIAELSAIVYNNAIIDTYVEIMVDSNVVTRHIYKLLKDIYNVSLNVEVVKKHNFNNKVTYVLTIKDNIDKILKDLSIYDNDGNYLIIPKDYIISDEEEIRAYFKGLFLVTGSINNPKKSGYHLEFVVNNLDYANMINSLLNVYNLNSKVLKREKGYMVYIKEAEKISDFLRLIKAYNAVLYFEDIRIYRDHKNMTNRLNNCEQANMDKVFITSNKQLKDINKLMEYGVFDSLDSRLQEVIKYRLEYKEASLFELSTIITKKTGKVITKSGLNHRFRKIREMVEKLDKEKK
ncbi:MAG: DNA-binding protein WhiA [bacterium]|nr:DNA-binding protein WhiA [bacterium]